MPGVTGMEILEAASKTDNFPPMILITAFGDEKTHEQAERLGVLAFLSNNMIMCISLSNLIVTLSRDCQIPPIQLDFYVAFGNTR